MTALQTHEPAVTPPGLTAEQVEASRRAHGANVLTPPARDPWWKVYLEKYDDPVIRILLIAALIAIGVGVVDGTYVEGIGIILAILLATTLAFLNEYKANREFDILNQTSDDVPIKVRRAGGYTTVPRKDLVVGDLVLVEAGEEVPVDGRLLEAVSLQVNEARLTGESRPVDKVAAGRPGPRPDTAYPPDRALRGTTVVDGYGLLEAAAVGDGTEIGRTAREAGEETDEETPLNRQLGRLSKLIGVVGLGVAALTFAALVGRGVLTGELALSPGQWYFAGVLAVAGLLALVRVWLPIVYDGLVMAGASDGPPEWLETEGVAGWLTTLGAGAAAFALGTGFGVLLGWLPAAPAGWLPAAAGHEFLTYFMIAVTIIVVAVPEGLAMSVTLSLAYSMRKMTASNNLVRRMHACETIGAATVICSDKTGTLTLNEMRVHEVNFPGIVGGALPADPGPLGALVIEAICANTTAHLSRPPGEPVRPLGNPTEGALLLWLDAAGDDYILPRTRFAITAQWTFTTDRKFMGTIGRSAVLNAPVLHAKGAPEIVLDRCTREATEAGPRPLDDARRDAIRQALRAYQGRGMRTLAFAYHDVPDHRAGAAVEDLAQDMVWLGFAAIADPVRPEVPSAIEACRRAGVQVKVVTGDNPETGQEIARQIGLWNADDDAHPDRHLTGAVLGRLDDAAAAAAARELKVLSRARPTDKMRLVRLLQEQGQVVAVTGDGVNDGPALNYADVGLAMGKTGTAVAKEASDIILLDDSFRSIVNAIMWGRSLYENIQRFILFQLTINVAALALAFLGPFIGMQLPLTVMQMLWVNLIMDTFAALALATEPAHPHVMDRPPRSPQAFIISGPMARNILLTAGLFLAVLIGLVLYLQRQGELPDTNAATRGGTILFTMFVLLQFWNLFNARCLGRRRSAFAGLGENKPFLAIAASIFVGQLLLVQFGGAAFRTVPLSAADWLLLTAGTSVVLWAGELVRFVRRANASAASPAG